VRAQRRFQFCRGICANSWLYFSSKVRLLFTVLNEAGGIIPDRRLRLGNEIVLLPILSPFRAVEKLLRVPCPLEVVDPVVDGLKVP
jgi:hypothetical protein